MNIEDYFFILIPSASGKSDINTIFRLSLIPRMLNKGFFPSVSNNKGIPAARTNLVDKLRISLDKMGVKHHGYVRALFWDDDLIIHPEYDVGKLVEAIKKADENDWNLVANYKVEFTKEQPTTNVMMHKAEFGQYRFYTDEEISGLKDFDLIPDTVSGLGFYYGKVPLDYKFHYDAYPEDVNFFEDNKIELRYLNLPLMHEKRCYI